MSVRRIFVCVVLVVAAAGWAAGGGFNADYCQANPYVPSSDFAPSDLELAFVQVITRHGARVPTSEPVMQNPDNISWTCPLEQLTLPTVNDGGQTIPVPGRLYRLSYLPGRQLLPGNCMFGQLQATGAAQHETLGRNFRAAYVQQHKLVASASEVWVRSTNFQRTINSVEADLLGMFPAAGQSTVATVDIRSMDSQTENMLPNSQLCPRLSAVYAQQEATPQWQAFVQNQSVTQQQIAALGYYGGDPSAVSVGSFCDMCWCRQCSGFGLPPGVSRQLFDTAVQQETEANNYLFWGGPISLPWAIGSFVGELRDNVLAYVRSGAAAVPAPFMFFSGHDSTIGPLANALFQLTDLPWPPYASHIEIELWRAAANQSYFVKTSFNGRDFLMPNCSQVVCPVDQWVSSVSWCVPDNFAVECNQSPPPLSGAQDTDSASLLRFGKRPSPFS